MFLFEDSASIAAAVFCFSWIKGWGHAGYGRLAGRSVCSSSGKGS
jgi:hypothetical protein